jgi:hypothetical protein
MFSCGLPKKPLIVCFPDPGPKPILNFLADRYGWEAGLALVSTAIIMTCIVRLHDVRHLRYVRQKAEFQFTSSWIGTRHRRLEFIATTGSETAPETNRDIKHVADNTDIEATAVGKQGANAAEVEMGLAK